MNYYPHHIGDYNRDTAHLSVTEHGVYRLLMDHYYSTERPLPNDVNALCRIIRATSKAEREAVQMVARTYFAETANGLSHGRIEYEIAEYAVVKARNASNGRKGGRKPNAKPPPQPNGTDSEPSGLSVASRSLTQTEPSQEPRAKSTSFGSTPPPPHLPEPPASPSEVLVASNGVEREQKPPQLPADFESFWIAYPRKTGKLAALKAWKKASNKPPLELILQALATQRESQQWKRENGQFIPHPATWLNQGRWSDEPTLTPAQADDLAF